MSSDDVENKKPVCFVVMPISDVAGYEVGHFGRVYEYVFKPAIVEAGFRPIRADDTNKTDYIVTGIIQRVVQSAMVLCDYSARTPNVMYELGVRHAFNLPVTLVKDKRTDKIFDIQGLRYTEYDESLRVDSVQKDIAKVSKALKETQEAGADSFNSIVQLAGIDAARVPDKQKVSVDTQVILSVLSGIEKRVEAIEGASSTREQFFTINGNTIQFNDTSTADLNEEIYDNGKEVGTIIDIHPGDGKIYVKREDGKVIVFSAASVKARSLSGLPF